MAKRLNVLVLAIQMAACSALGVVATNDPYMKVVQAHSLKQSGRFLMAERMLREAEALLDENPDVETEADVYFAYGSLYQSIYANQQAGKLQGFGLPEERYASSADSYHRAIELFRSVDSDVGVAKSMIELGDLYNRGEERELGCESYQSGLKTYNDGKAAGRITAEPVIYDPQFKSVGEIAMSYICSKCMDPPVTAHQACFATFE